MKRLWLWVGGLGMGLKGVVGMGLRLVVEGGGFGGGGGGWEREKVGMWIFVCRWGAVRRVGGDACIVDSNGRSHATIDAYAS